MKTIAVCCFALLLAACAWCQTGSAQLADKHSSPYGPYYARNVLGAVVPSELARFGELAAKGYDRATAEAALALVKRTRELWHELWTKHKGNRKEIYKGMRPGFTPGMCHPDEGRYATEVAQMYAWIYVIRVWKRTTDPGVKSLIMNAWNSSLTTRADPQLRPPLDIPEVTWQIRALVCEWDRGFLTDAFIKLFRQTNDPILISDFASAFLRGEEPEQALIKEKLAAMRADKSIAGTAAYEANVNDLNFALSQISENIRNRPGPGPSLPEKNSFGR